MNDRVDARQVFISYSRRNEEFVRRLITDLQAVGVPVWIDRQGLKPGTPNWDQALRDAIQSARAVVLVASPDSRRSAYVPDELTIAELYKCPVFPIWALGTDFIDCVPLGMGKVQAVDMRGDAYKKGLDDLLTALLDVPLSNLGINVMPDEATPEPDFEPRNPYKGLKSFTSTDTTDFFGRDELITELAQTLEKTGVSRFLAVIGASGSGKSSVVLAGLLPRLLASRSDWLFLSPVVPGIRPLESLAVALSNAIPGSLSTTILDALQRPDDSSRTLHLLAKQAQNATGKPEKTARVVLFIDQFEELFTQTTNEPDRQQMIDLLTTAVTEPGGLLTVIITLRADFYDRPLKYADLGRLIEANTHPILPMSLTGLRDVIQKPAELADVKMTFDDGLTADLVFAMREEPNALPLLQFTLDQLFQRREGHRLTRKAYYEIGEMMGALANHAEQTYLVLPSDKHRALAEALFLRLIEPGATEQDTTRRRTPLNELTLPNADDTAILRAVMDAFVAARLLTTNRIVTQDTLEVSHEALIREWTRLGEWLKNTRDDVRLQKTISQNTTEWVGRGRKANDDGLYRGTLLSNAQDWANRSVPSADEMAFIQAGVEETQRRTNLEQENYKEKLEAQRRATNASSLLVKVFGLFFIVAITLTILAINSRNESINHAATAISNAFTATVAQGQAQQQKATAIANAATATVAQGQAVIAKATSEYNAGQAQQQKATAVAALATSQRRADLAQSLLLANHAQDAINQGNLDLALALAVQANAIENPPIQAQRALASSAFSPGTRFRLVGHSDWVWSFAASANGRYLASASFDNTIILWDLKTGKHVRQFQGHRFAVRAVAFSPDEQTLVSGADDGDVILWNIRTGEMVQRYHPWKNQVRALSLSSDGNTALIAYNDGHLLSLKLSQGSINNQAQAAQAEIWSMALSPDGQTALIGAADGSLLIWDLKTFQFANQLGQHSAQILSIAFSPDGTKALSGSDDGKVRLWDVRQSTLIRELAGHNSTAYVWGVAFSPDGQAALSGASDHKMLLWNVQSGDLVQQFIGHDDEITHVGFAPDGNNALISASRDKTLRIWDAQDGRQAFTSRQHTSAVRSIAITPNGKMALSSADDGRLILWDLVNRVSLGVLSSYQAPILTIAISPDNHSALVAGGTVDYSVIAWDIVRRKEVRRLNGHTNWITSLAISPDGRMAVSGSHDHEIILWDLTTGGEIRRFVGHNGWVLSVAFAPDGHTILSGGRDTTVRLWDVTTGKELKTFNGHKNWVTSVAFSPDGQIALSGSRDNTVIIWDLASGKQKRQMTGQTPFVTSMKIAVSPDGQIVASASTDHRVVLWDIQTGQQIEQVQEPFSGVYSLAFSPDGHAIFSGKDDGTVTEWQFLKLEELRQWLSTHRYVRALTDDEKRRFNVAPH